MTDLQKLHTFLILEIAEGNVKTEEEVDLFNTRLEVLAAMTLEADGVVYEDGFYPANVIEPVKQDLGKSIIVDGVAVAEQMAAQAA